MKTEPLRKKSTAGAETPAAGASTICGDAIDALLRYIHDNHLKVGSVLPTAETFCKQHNFSRVAFREALSYLKGLGVLSSGRGKNIQVSDVDPIRIFSKLLPIFFSISDDFEEITSLRVANEIGIFPSVIAKATPADIVELEAVVRESEDLMRRRGGSIGDFCLLDSKFHSILCRISGNRLAMLISRYSECLFFPALQDRSGIIDDQVRDSFERTNLDHWNIINIIKTKNVDIGMLMIVEHLWKVYENGTPNRRKGAGDSGGKPVPFSG